MGLFYVIGKGLFTGGLSVRRACAGLVCAAAYGASFVFLRGVPALTGPGYFCAVTNGTGLFRAGDWG